jgi:hypothetical protein
MIESIQQSGSEVAIVIYDTPCPPRYFRFSKRFIKTLFVVVPVLFILLLCGLFFWGLSSRVKDAPAPTFPVVLSEQESKVATLESEMKALQESNKALTEKLNTQPSPGVLNDPHLMAIKKPYGMQNLISLNTVSLDQFDLTQENTKVSLKFQIISQGQERKIIGHVLVFMVSASGLMAYPKEANMHLGEGIKYSEGEPFAVSRLRPTNAEFSLRLVGENVKFVIYIFSREGDLLLIKETENYPVSTKS